MSRIISVHEYLLRRGAAATEFEAALRAARNRGLLTLPGLERSYLLKGLRGLRQDRYAAVWIYGSREAWERLWGPLEAPYGGDRYPHNWRVWEDEVLAPYLAEEPDEITYTAYRELE